METTYPKLTALQLTPFRVLKSQLAVKPDLLTDETCPYDPDTVAFLQVLFTGETSDGPSFLDAEDGELAALERKVAQVIREIETFETKYNLDNKDRIQFIKVKTSMLERLIEYRERIFNMKTLSDFQVRIFGFIEDHLSADGRTELILKLREHVGMEAR